MIKRSVLAVVVLLLVACAAPGVRDARQRTDLPRQQELTATPFFPQELYQCGPAALATVLGAAGFPTTPEQLTPQVYVPARQGSLQVEMLAAARRQGAIAMLIPPRLDALLQEVASGHSVLVLQNLGLSWVPTWHYAVVVGYDLDDGVVWLRSGTTRRQEMSLNTFQRTWARSGHWAMVAVPPGELPASVSETEVIHTLVAYEKNASAASVSKAYAAAAQRWPNSLVLLIGAGNSAYAARNFPAALAAFQRAAAAHPESAAAHNNLATVLLDLGRYREAKASAEKAQALAGDSASLRETIHETLRAIERRAPSAR